MKFTIRLTPALRSIAGDSGGEVRGVRKVSRSMPCPMLKRLRPIDRRFRWL